MPACVMQGKVGSAFTSVGGHGRGYGGHEAILQGFHCCFLQHGMVRTPCCSFSDASAFNRRPAARTLAISIACLSTCNVWVACVV